MIRTRILEKTPRRLTNASQSAEAQGRDPPLVLKKDQLQKM